MDKQEMIERLESVDRVLGMIDLIMNSGDEMPIYYAQEDLKDVIHELKKED